MKFSRIDPIWLYEAKKSISTESLVHSPHLELNGELISLSMHTGSQNMNPQRQESALLGVPSKMTGCDQRFGQKKHSPAFK